MTRPVTAAICAVALLLLVIEAGMLVKSLSLDQSSVEQVQGRRTLALALKPPADLPSRGSMVESQVSGRGDLRVTQWIHSDARLDRIRLSAYHPLGLPAAPRATHVLVTAGGRIISQGGEVGVSGRTYLFPRPARIVYLSYLLTGTTDVSQSVTGRTLVRLTALDVDYEPREGPTLFSVTGEVVRNLACLHRSTPGALARPCGAPRNNGWTVRLTGPDRDDRVIAQVDIGDGGVTGTEAG